VVLAVAAVLEEQVRVAMEVLPQVAVEEHQLAEVVALVLLFSIGLKDIKNEIRMD
jgi:hypothetical protein